MSKHSLAYRVRLYARLITYMTKSLFILPLLIYSLIATAQNSSAIIDSIDLAVHPAYNNVSTSNKKFCGKNYTKEWAARMKLSVAKIS